MRRFLIRYVLPLVFCVIPWLAGLVIVVAIPGDAFRDYVNRLRNSPFDWLILSLGAVLFICQTILAWRALQWRETGFYEGSDRWLSSLAQAAEWFPLLGLLGTVAAILQTFSAIPTTGTITPGEVIRRYAPAITATGSGLFMALMNILPTWIVATGRDLILALNGGPTSDEPN